MKKDVVVEILQSLGFIPEEIEEVGFSFEYEGISMIWPVREDEDESDSLSLLVPCIVELTEENHDAVLETIAEICHRMKYVQPNIMFEREVWLNYVHYLGDNEVTPELVEHMVRVLEAGFANFSTVMKEKEDKDDD